METECQDVIVETIYDHLSSRRKARWASAYRQMASFKTSWDWNLTWVWNHLIHRILTDQYEGVLAHANKREREALTRIADLYQRLMKGEEPPRDEWMNAERDAFKIGTAKQFLISWKMYIWLLVMVVAIGFAIASCFPVVKGFAVVAGLIAAWAGLEAHQAEQLARIPIQASRKRVFAAWNAAKWPAKHPDELGILEFELRDGNEDYTAQEEWMAETLKMAAEASAATQSESALKMGLTTGLLDGSESEKYKQEYWNWLSEALLQTLRESAAEATSP